MSMEYTWAPKRQDLLEYLILSTVLEFCDREQNIQTYQTMEVRCPDLNRNNNDYRLDGIPHDASIVVFNR